MLRVKSMLLLNSKKVDFELNAGEGIVIRGNNGSGKSLLLKSLARLIPSQCETYQYQGHDITSYSPEGLRSDLLYVSASPLSLNQGSVEDFFESAFNLKIYKNFKPTFPYKEYIERWNLKHKNFQSLSSGQKQMLSLLRAISLKAKVLLLDEPTANLDNEKTLEIENLVKNWMKDTGGSAVLISHSDDQTARMGFKVVQFENLITSGGI